MTFFDNMQDSPISLQPPLHDLPMNPNNFSLRYIYEESRMTEDHVKVLKEIFNRKKVQHKDVVIHLFPYTFGETFF